MFWLPSSIETTRPPLVPLMPLSNLMPSNLMLVPPETVSWPIVASSAPSARTVTVLP